MTFDPEEAKKQYVEFMKDSVAAFAPGRIEFLGNHLDYNGGTVLGTAINAGIYGLAQPREDQKFHLFSESFEGAKIDGDLQNLEKQTGSKSWGNYCIGVLRQLQLENLAPKMGFSLILTTDLPMSAGLSSSAALELSTALCLTQLANQKVSKKDLVNLCRKAENDWVGLPCGILDQGTSAFGEKDKVVQINCENEEFSTLTLPTDTQLWIFNTGIKHDLIDSLYGKRNQECMDALKILQKSNPELSHLTQASMEQLEDLDMQDDLKKRTLHIISEQKRVYDFSMGVKNKIPPHKLGEFLFASHQSSSELFENSLPELDFLVDTMKNSKNIHGARLTGGGFGGAVLAWTNHKFSETDALDISQKYKNKWGNLPTFHSFHPSDGAKNRNPLSQS
tara:strand:- start:376 stop:1551 length:1176 start_codon:yes stop_codon:yes gene_type:complete